MDNFLSYPAEWSVRQAGQASKLCRFVILLTSHVDAHSKCLLFQSRCFIIVCLKASLIVLSYCCFGASVKHVAYLNTDGLLMI